MLSIFLIKKLITGVMDDIRPNSSIVQLLRINEEGFVLISRGVCNSEFREWKSGGHEFKG